jgi:hypothetical protein
MMGGSTGLEANRAERTKVCDLHSARRALFSQSDRFNVGAGCRLRVTRSAEEVLYTRQRHSGWVQARGGFDG